MPELINSVLGLVVYSCLIYGAVKKSEKMLIPALVVIPINFVLYVIAIIQVLSSPTVAFAVTAIAVAVILTALTIPTWIVIYSFRQELQESTEIA